VLGKFPTPKWKKVYVSDNDGKLIFPLVKHALDNNTKVEISFKDLDPTQGFVDKAIGGLYGYYPMEFVDNNIEVTGLNDLSEYVLESTLRIVKLYHYHRDRYDRIMEDFALISGESWDEEEDDDDDEKEEEEETI
jgi:hypothetical protein